MKKKETRYNEFPINFDEEVYQTKLSAKDKSDYIFSLLTSFFSRNFDQFPISLANQAIPTFQKFFDILPTSFEMQNSPSFFSLIPQFLVCFQPYYDEIPHAELYMNAYDYIVGEYIKLPAPITIESLKILFQSRKFCETFLETSRINQLLQNNMPENENFDKLLNIINTQALFDEIKARNDYKQLIVDLYNFVSESEITYSDHYFVSFLHFILGIVIKLFKYGQFDGESNINSEKVFDDILFSTGIFEKINKFLVYLDDGEVTWSTFHPLMTCSADPNEIPYDLKIFLQLNKIFINDGFSLKSKKTVLLELLHDNIIFESPFCINQTQFPIHLWIIKELVCDEEFFSIYIKIIEKCISIDQSSALYSIHEFIELLSPPIQKKEIFYNKIFEWMSKIVNPVNFPNSHPIDSSIFNDDFFYDSLLINPSLKVVDEYFNFPHFHELFSLLFDFRRTRYHRKDLISRVFDLIGLNHSKYVKHYKMDQLILSNFEVNILNYYIDNITDSRVVSLFSIMNSEIFIRMPQLFRAGNTFSIVERHMKEDDPSNCENYLRELLMLIHSIANYSKDMFFDDWVLTLPKESPIFKMPNEIISSFVFSESVIFLPSLVPILQNADFSSYSPYNHYLLGRYSVPVALKLGIQLPNLPSICQHYISFDTYNHLMKTGQIVNLVRRSKKNEEVQCYEFFVGALPGSITLPSPEAIVNETQYFFNYPDSQNLGGPSNYIFVMFYVKFIEVPTNLFPFLHVSKTTFYINEDYIAYGENGKKKIRQIHSNVWYLIRVQKTKIMNWTEFYIDNKKELTLREAFNFEMIGDSKSQVSTSFFIAQNIFATTFLPENSVINRFNLNYQRSINPILHGGVVSAPIFSISNLLRENYTYLHNFDNFDEILHNSKLKKLNGEIELIKDFFVFLIQTADYLADNQCYFFYNRFLCSMMMNPEFFTQFHIVGLIQSILMLKNPQIRTSIFISTLFNLELWHQLDVQLLIDYVQYINNNDAVDLDWKMILTKQNFLFSINLIHYANSKYDPQQLDKSYSSSSNPKLYMKGERSSSFDFERNCSYTPLFKEFFIFWENITRILKPENLIPVLKELSELCCIPEMSNLNANVNISQYDVKEVLENKLKANYESENDIYDISIAIRVKTVLFIQKLERSAKQPATFSNGMLLYFSLFMPVPIAQALFLSFMQIRCEENNSYLVETLPIISKIAQRFCDSSLIWSLFVRQLTGDKSFQIDLDSPTKKIEVPKKIECPQIFSILIEMFIALSVKYNSSLSDSGDIEKSDKLSSSNEKTPNKIKKENALKLMSELFKFNEHVYWLEEANLPSLIHLISGGKFKDDKRNNNVLKFQNYSINIESMDLPNKLSAIELKTLESKIIENKDLFIELIERYSFQPVSNVSEVKVFAASILIKIFLYLTDKKLNNRLVIFFSLLSDIADDYVLMHTLQSIFSFMSGRPKSPSIVNLLINVVSNLLIKRKNIFKVRLFSSIIDFSTSLLTPHESADNENENENNENDNGSRKDSFNNDANNNDCFKMMVPFLTVALYEMGKIDKKRVDFNKLVKKFMEHSQLLIDEFQPISIILIYIFIYYKVEDFENGEIKAFYKQLKENYVVNTNTPLFWDVIDLTPDYSSLLITVYFKVASPLATPVSSTNALTPQSSTEVNSLSKASFHSSLNIALSAIGSSSSSVDFTSANNFSEMVSKSDSTSNFIVLVRESLEQFKVFFNDWVSNYLHSVHMDLSYRDLPISQAQTLTKNIGYYITREILMYFVENRFYFLNLNTRMRYREKLFSFFIAKSFTNKSQIGKLQCRSFRASPFSAPTACPVVCMPSTFAIKTPDSNQNSAELMKSKSLPLQQTDAINQNNSDMEQSPLIRDQSQESQETKQEQEQQEQQEAKQEQENQEQQEQQETKQEQQETKQEQEQQEQQETKQEQEQQEQQEIKQEQENQEQQETKQEQQETKQEQQETKQEQQETKQEQEQQEQQETKQEQEQQEQQEIKQEQENQEQQETKQEQQETKQEQEQQETKQEQEQQETKHEQESTQEKDQQENENQDENEKKEEGSNAGVQEPEKSQEPEDQANESWQKESEQQTQENQVNDSQKQELEQAQENKDGEPEHETQQAQENQAGGSRQQELEQAQESKDSESQKAQEEQKQPELAKEESSQQDSILTLESEASNASSKASVTSPQPQESQYLSSLDLLTNKSAEFDLHQHRHQADFECDTQLHNYYDIVMLHSPLLNVGSQHLYDMFKDIYGEIAQYHQCTLIRQFFRIPCICFNMPLQGRILILTDATTSEECKIKLLEPTSHLSESFLMNEFGPYSIFCGHFVINVDVDGIIMSSKFISRGKESSLLFFSVSNGSFILEFLFFSIINPSDLKLSIKISQQLWLNKFISNKFYLEILNFFGMRSFEDFSAYPIFPRVIQDVSKLIFQTKDDQIDSNLRDLSKPIQVIGYDDSQFFVKRFQMYHFHYFENLSNSITVSALNLRLAPFCFQQWYLNDGWDKGERNFLSASPRLSATKKTIDELPPEMFCYPEVLMNKNQFRLPNGKLFNLQFPEWCNCGHCNLCKKCGKNNGFSGCKKAPFFFVEYMRYALEHDDVRKNLNKWIDLNFGDKLMSEEELNVYHPLSFVAPPANDGSADVATAAKKLEEQRAWMLQCGQVPKKIFDQPHPQYDSSKQLYSADFNPLNFVFSPKEFTFMANLNKFPMNRPNTSSNGFAFYPPYVFTANISKDTVVNVRNNIEFVENMKTQILRSVIDISPSLFFKKHVEILTDFIVITYAMSLVTVYKIIKTEKGFNVILTGTLCCSSFKKKKKVTKIEGTENNNESDLSVGLNSSNDFLHYSHSFNGEGDIIDDNGVVDYNDIGDVDDSYIEEKPLFSTLHVKQFLCATVCSTEVIIWCFSTSMVVARIDLNANIEKVENDGQKIGIITAKFDEEINVLYLTTSNGELHQYSLNGQLIRKIDLKTAVTAIEIIPSGFSVFTRYIVTGHMDGSVRILKVDLETREFVVVKEKNLFQLRVARIIPHRDSYVIDVYVIPSRLI